MDLRCASDAVRRASGLPHLSVLTDPVRVARVREIAAGRGRLGGAAVPRARWPPRSPRRDCAQLSLLADEQVATAVRCDDADSLAGDERARRQPVHRHRAVGRRAGRRRRAGPPVAARPPAGACPVRCATTSACRCCWPTGRPSERCASTDPEPREWSDRDVGLTCDVADVVALELRRLVGSGVTGADCAGR